MNYLAHAFLSGNDPGLLVGNFVADHIRGNELADYSNEIRNGIMLHRRIDSFTDSHNGFRKAKRLFYDGFERHSGILVDIYFDHLLARDFKNYAAVPLDAFSRNVYAVYEKHRPILPAGSGRFLDYLIRNNVYQSYATEEGIGTVLNHLSHRIRHGVELDESIYLFRSKKSELETQFIAFMADLRREFGLT